MTMTNEIASVTIPVTAYQPEKAGQQQRVPFRIFREDDWFQATPGLSTNERATLGLPEAMVFICINRELVAANHMEEESLTVINHIISELAAKSLL